MSSASFKLDNYQEDAVAQMLRQRGCGVYMDQGTGKTIVTLEAVARIAAKKSSIKALIICLKAGVNATWREAIQKFYPYIEDIIDIIHYEQAVKQRDRLRRKNYDVVVFDESQRIANRNSKSSRLAKSLNRASYKFALSGTPLDGNDDETNPIDLWAQFRFFAPHVFGERWQDFEDRYLRRTGYMGYQRKFKQSMLREFIEKTKPYTIRISRSVLGMEKMTIHKTYVTMNPAEKEAYRAILDDGIFTDTRLTSSAPLAVTAIIRCQQITSGFIRDDNGNDHRLAGIGSKEIMLSTLFRKNTDQQIVVFCRFLPDLETAKRVCLKRGVSFRLLWGKTTDVDRVKNDFLANRFQVLISQIKKGGTGLDLYSAQVGIIYSLTYSSRDFEQLKARLHRRGQTGKVRIYPLIARDSIDEHIMNVLVNKTRFNKGLLRHFNRSKQFYGCKSKKNKKAR